MSRVLIVGRTRVYRDALASELKGVREISMAATAPTAEIALSKAKEVGPDVVLVDLPLAEGYRVFRLLQSLEPPPKLIAVAVPQSSQEIIGWATAGASGCITQDATVVELVTAIVEVANGGTRCSSAADRILFEHVRSFGGRAPSSLPQARLTRRQIEIARLLAERLSNKEIASALSIEVATVKNHVHEILRKTGLHDRMAVSMWFSDGSNQE